MLSIRRHLPLTAFVVASFAQPAFAHLHSSAAHRSFYRHDHHREFVALRHRGEIVSHRFARLRWRRRIYAYAPDNFASPAGAPDYRYDQYTAGGFFTPMQNRRVRRIRTAWFAQDVAARPVFADSARAYWRPTDWRSPSRRSSYRGDLTWNDERSAAWNFSAQGSAENSFAGGSQWQSMAEQQASSNGIPVSLVDRVIRRESGGNARAVSRGNYGLMQIRLGTARAMGYGGSAVGLLDPTTNMTYAVRYLAGAYRAAGGSESRAVALYARGYNATPRPVQYSF